MPYTKLFSSIITSTIWMEDNDTRIVWITMLAISDKNGEVQASVPGLARVAGVPLTACQAALDKFLSPDEHSRTKDDEGRRVEVIPGGWALINHAKYRDLASREEDIRANAERQRRHRAKKARNGEVTPEVTENENSNATVTPRNGEVTESLHIADTDTDTDTLLPTEEGGNSFSLSQEKPKRKDKSRGTLEEFRTFAVEIGLRASDGEAKFHGFEANGWKIGKGAVKDWKATMRNWKENGYHPSQKNGVENEPAPKVEYYPAKPQQTIAEMMEKLEIEHQARIDAEQCYYDDDTR